MAKNNELRALLMKAAIDTLPWWSQKKHYSMLQDFENAKEVAISDIRTGEFKPDVKNENDNSMDTETITFNYWVYKINDKRFRVSRKMAPCFVKGDKLREEADDCCGMMTVYELKKIQDS